MPRLMERPESIRRELAVRSEKGGFPQSTLERVNRPARVPGHEKAEAIELRQTLRENVTSFFFQVDKL